MHKGALIGLRVAQAVFDLVVLGLTAWAASVATQRYCVYIDEFGDEDCVQGTFGGLGAFLLYDTIWTILTLVVLAILPIFVTINSILVVVLDGLAMLLWFSGAVGYAAIVGSYGDAISDVVIAFSFVLWALFLATFVLNLLGVLQGNKSHLNQPHPTDAPATNQFGTAHQQAPPMQQPAGNADYYNQNPELAHV